MILSERTWLRHANPWSVWTRYAAFPLLVLAVWSWHWIGCWSIVAISAVVLFLIVNPWLFPQPRSTRNWASMAVLGERVWLAEQRAFLPQQFPRPYYSIAALSFANIVALGWGIYATDMVLTIVSTINVLVAKSWSNDRMVWLFTERCRTSPEYASWLR
jgi:hypothetical protein